MVSSPSSNYVGAIVIAVITATLPLRVHSQTAEQTGSQTQNTNNQAGTVNELKEITVRGQALHRPPLAGSSTSYSDTLQKRGITNWADFSKRGEPGVYFNRQNNSINIRGMDADRVVTLLDDIPLPWLSDGARGVQGGLNALSFDSLDAISFSGNAGTIRSGAVTGILNATSLSPSQLLSGGKPFTTRLRSSYGSASHSKNVNALIAGHLTANTLGLLQIGWRRGDELRNYDGKGGYGPERTLVNPLQFKESSISLKMEHNLGTNHRLEASGERFHYTSDIQNRRDQGPDTSFEINGNSSTETIKRERLLLGYQYQASDAITAVDQGHIKTWWQRMQLDSSQNAQRLPDERGSIIPGDPFRYQFPFGRYTRDNSISETSYGVTTQWSGFLEQETTLHNWSAGGHWYRSSTKQASSGYDNCPIIPPGFPAPFGPRSCDLLHTGQADMPLVNGNHLALWVQDDIAWNEDRYMLTPGLRFDSYAYKPKTGADYAGNPNADLADLATNRSSRFSPSLRVTFNPSESLSIYASYAHGFKAPSPSQLYLNYGAPGTYLSVGNPALKPETSRGIELGLEAGTPSLGGIVRVFHNRYQDFIDTDYAVAPGDANWNPIWTGQYPMGVTMAINRARVRIYGAEASGHWHMNTNWYGRATIAWARGKDMNTNQALNTIAPLKTQLTVGYEQSSWGAEAQLTLVARRSRVANADTDFQAPGYGTTDLTAWWEPSAIKGLKLQAGVYNLFNKKYWDALNVPSSGRSLAPTDYYSEPGRSFRLTFNYSY